MAQKDGKVVGYTTGVFDLFHIGHLNVLRRSKELCDELIVGVTTDELSLSRKSKMPVIPFNERMEIVSSLKFVDRVVAQASMDKILAWQEIQFDRMFVGNDWQGTDAWQKIERDFAEFGVKIYYLPYTDSTSSTKLRAVLDSLLESVK